MCGQDRNGRAIVSSCTICTPSSCKGAVNLYETDACNQPDQFRYSKHMILLISYVGICEPTRVCLKALGCQLAIYLVSTPNSWPVNMMHTVIIIHINTPWGGREV